MNSHRLGCFLTSNLLDAEHLRHWEGVAVPEFDVVVVMRCEIQFEMAAATGAVRHPCGCCEFIGSRTKETVMNLPPCTFASSSWPTNSLPLKLSE